MTDTENGYASRDTLLGGHKRRYRDFTLPGGQKVRLQSITERERSDWESHVKVKKGQITRDSLLLMRARLIVRCLVDPDGNLLLRHDDAHDILGWDSAVSNALFEVCQEHCGISEADMEGLEKNCERIPAGVSPTA